MKALSHRFFDMFLALVLMLIVALPFAFLLIWLLWREGRPLFHTSERMKTPRQAFQLRKLRTMTLLPEGADTGVSGGDKSARITPTGAFLRRTRLDEIPQLWNILRGDMGFVGPRPPLRQYVERFPQLYEEVLRSRPGITGVATLHFHRNEERLLAACTTADETDAVYARRCVPRKARLDLIHARNRSICFDLALILKTAVAVLRRNFNA